MSVTLENHLKVLVNSLATLSPSRNVISQLVLMLPRDLPTIEKSYPEAMDQDAKTFWKPSA